mmetsp:Transcript_20223/g.34429  ORF Transcript_20223/g.34429 Transcript_20223/m.34429 type:complete len:88 (-) Transcript_20223:950-1213(-)
MAVHWERDRRLRERARRRRYRRATSLAAGKAPESSEATPSNSSPAPASSALMANGLTEVLPSASEDAGVAFEKRENAKVVLYGDAST